MEEESEEEVNEEMEDETNEQTEVDQMSTNETNPGKNQ